MNTLLTFLLVVICCVLSGAIGFVAGRGGITIVAPMTKEQKERNERLLREAEEQMIAYNAGIRTIVDFGSDVDGLGRI